MPAINEQHQAFITQCTAIIANAKLIAASLAPNTVQVWPGGAVFTSIQAAIDSITKASKEEQYQVAVGSGTYKENITMKDYVYVIGAEQSLTTITAPAQVDFVAVVNSASGCGISELTIDAPGGAENAAPAGIKICGKGFFHISGVTINSGTAGTKDNDVKGIHNMYGSPSGDVIIGSSIININGGAGADGIGINLFGASGSAPLNVTIELSTIKVNPGPKGCYGVTAATTAAVVLNESTITASTYTLDNDGAGSPITANKCIINGPVSKNVVVNP